MNQTSHFIVQLRHLLQSRLFKIPVGPDRFFFWGSYFVWAAILFVTGYRSFLFGYGMVLGGCLIWASITDIRWHIVPLFLMIPGIVGFSIIRLVMEPTLFIVPFLTELLLILCAGSIINIVYRSIRGRSGWGWGDTAVLLLVGSAMGGVATFFVFISGLVCAAIWSVWLLIKGGGHAQTPIPLTPFFTLGTLLLWIWGKEACILWCKTYLIFI